MPTEPMTPEYLTSLIRNSLAAGGFSPGNADTVSRHLVDAEMKGVSSHGVNRLGRGGEVKIADFGVALDANAASLTRSGQALGTPAYMSPEQLRGERVDTRSDLFAYGVTLYELLAGIPPFRPSDDEESPLGLMEKGRFAPLRRVAPA